MCIRVRATTQGGRCWSIPSGPAAALLIIGWWHDPFGLNVYSGFWTLVLSSAVLILVSLFTLPVRPEVLRHFELAPPLNENRDSVLS